MDKKAEIQSQMSKDAFWATIEKSRKAAGTDDFAFSQEIRWRLSRLSDEDLGLFQRILREYTGVFDDSNLRSTLEARIGTSLTDDALTDAYTWLISQGKESCLQVFRNPDSLTHRFPRIGMLPSLLIIAHQIYERRTGMPFIPKQLTTASETMLEDIRKEARCVGFTDVPEEDQPAKNHPAKKKKSNQRGDAR